MTERDERKRQDRRNDVTRKQEHERLEAAGKGATNRDMMSPSPPGCTRISVPPAKPRLETGKKETEDRWSTAPPPWMVEYEEERNKLSKLWEKKGPRRVKIDVIGTTADETTPSKAAELRRAAAEKKGMQEQFREWFEGGRGARARGRGGAGRRSGGRR